MDTTPSGTNPVSNSPADLTKAQKAERINDLLQDVTQDDKETVFAIWCDNLGIKDPSEADVETCFECYAGWFRHREAFAEDLCDNLGVTDPIPEGLRFYFDYDLYGRDLLLSGDYWEVDGHYFRNE